MQTDIVNVEKFTKTYDRLVLFTIFTTVEFTGSAGPHSSRKRAGVSASFPVISKASEEPVESSLTMLWYSATTPL